MAQRKTLNISTAFGALSMALLGCLGNFAQANGTDVIKNKITSLTDCNSLSPTNYTRSLCEGPGEYSLIVEEDNLRQTLAIRSSEGEVQLDLFKTVSPAPSRLGDDAEWELRGDLPIAVIVRLNTDSAPLSQIRPSFENYNQSSWVVIKLDPQASCVVNTADVLAPHSLENARQIAYKAQEYGCL